MLKIDVDIKPALRKLDALQRKQVPFAASLALNRTANLVQNNLKSAMSGVFQAPKPYTLGGTFTKPSTKAKLQALVGLKDKAGRGVPPSKYLAAQVRGGPRRSTGYELALAKLGALPTGLRAVPAAGARLDRYGNLNQAQLTEIMGALRSGLRVFKGKGKRALAGGYFVARPGVRHTAHLHPGIYYRIERNGEGVIIPVLHFVSGVSYTPRLNVAKVASVTVARHFDRELHKALRQAIGSAR